MAGTLIVSNIEAQNYKYDSDTTAMIIDTSGNVTENNYVIEQWRLTTNESTSGNIVDNWERVDDATSSSINAGMTESSGVFTFPSTGLWLVTAQVAIYLEADGTAGVYIQVSSNSGSDYDNCGYVVEGGDSPANQSGAMSILVNVTNASTFRYQLKADSLTSPSMIRGDTDYNRTALIFERKGPAQ